METNGDLKTEDEKKPAIHVHKHFSCASCRRHRRFDNEMLTRLQINKKERNNSTITRDGKKYDIVLCWLASVRALADLAASAKWNL